MKMALHNSSISINGNATMESNNIAPMDSKTAKVQSPKYRNYLTFSLYVSFMALGMTAGLGGPTFIHLTYILDTDIETLAVTHTFGSIGYLTGSTLCGLIFDRFNAELQFALVTFLQGAAVILCPWSPTVYVYYAMDFLKALTMGYLDTSGQGYLIGLWTAHAFKEPIMQGMHGIWSVGATLAPYIILPFLSELPAEDTTDPIASNVTTALFENVTEAAPVAVDVESVRFGFAIVGGIIVCMSFCFFAAYCMLGPSCLKREKKKKTEDDTKQKKPQKAHNKWKIIAFLFLEFLFYAFYAWCELIPGNYLSPLVIKGLGWDVKYGPIITSVFWGFHGLGRIAAIPISYFVSPGKMLSLNLLFTFIGFAMMVVVPVTNDLVLWFSIAMAAFAMASSFASLILWTSEYIEITGSVGAVFLTGSSFGSMTCGTLTGYLFQRYSHLWVGVLSLVGVIGDIIAYILIYVFAKLLLDTDKKEILHEEEIELKPMEKSKE